ncbi:GNAT family N-acetyltransferase [Deinococcus yavapaiensis]|uniref:GNAT family N-acetyltransferase n=1 Tax=Deinococcus yavapaiensis TaxID=309889 RepID=UPI001FE6DB2D|nr:GNAT family N-acetyltransferase [Deinococcus yavapaiensis]
MATRVRLTTLAAEIERLGFTAWERLVALHNDALHGWPDPDPSPNANASRSAVAFRETLHGYGCLLDGFVVAVLRDEYVAYSGFGQREGDARLLSAGTAVRPTYRGLGLATAVKAKALLWARGGGYELVFTSSANPAMVRVNEKLGFVPGLAEVRLVKDLHVAVDGS